MIAMDTLVVSVLFSFCFAISRLSSLLTGSLRLFWQLLIILIPVYIVTFTFTGLYRNLWKYAQYREYLVCNVSSVIAGLLFFIISRILCNFDLIEKAPFYFYVLVMCTSAIGTVSIRLVYRFAVTRIRNMHGNKRRVMIVGCGNACAMLLNEIRISPECPLLPIVGVDDDGTKVGCTINGLKIEGTNEDVERLAREHKIDLIIIAIPSADNARRAKLLDYCAPVGCEVKMLPRLYDFSSESDTCISKLRSITPEELLGREPIKIDNQSIVDYVAGRTVVVTGGGGSIGSEICRQIAAFSPKKLVIIDIYENNAYEIQQELIQTYGASLDLEVHIASVRDRKHIFELFREIKPQIVIHAAAHKHVPLMEHAPTEAIKNNVLGTLNVAEASLNAGVDRFIMISTDKAVNPTNIMGATKRVCELIVEKLNGHGTEFCAVRFGNVLGSNGSVIPLFKKQIESGGPVTVTHPDIIRYFMTIPEAVQLVLAAGSMAKGGEIFVLNMGNPVKIDSMAKKLIALSGYQLGRDIDIVYTGLRPGEKLYEELLMAEEGLSATKHDKIFIGKTADIESNILFPTLDELARIANNDEMDPHERACKIELLIKNLVPEFKHYDPNGLYTPAAEENDA